MNNKLDKVNQWLCTNRLSTHLSKTYFMVFSNIKQSKNYTFTIDNHSISKTDSIEFLGAFI